MTTLTYGSIITILSTDNKYDNKFFFVERLDDTELCLVDELNNKLILPLTNGSLEESITNITIVYKPLGDYCKQNRLFEKQWIEIEFEDLNTVKGQITKITKNIEVKLKEQIIYLSVFRGQPKGVLRITKISKPINYEITKPTNEGEEVEDKLAEEINELEENAILGYVEEEKETGNIQYFYSIEQQTADLLEHLITYIPEEKRSPTALKKFLKIIKRYKELRNKYTDFTDGIKLNLLPSNILFQSTIENKNKLFTPLTKDVDVFLYELNEDDEDASLKDYIKYQDDENYLSRIINAVDKENIKFQEKIPLYNELVNNYIIHKKTNAKKMLFVPKEFNEVVLYDKETMLNKKRYIIRINEPYVIHSYISNPSIYLEHSKITQPSSNIMYKSNYGRIPFYTLFYTSLQQNIKNNKENEYFIKNNKYVYFENQTDSYEKYVNKLIPSLNSFIELGIDEQFIPKFYNFYQSIKNLNNINIYELTYQDYAVIKAFLINFVNEYKRNMESSGLPNKLVDINKLNISFENIVKLYSDVLPKQLNSYYYSNSEILKLVNVDFNNYYFKSFIKNLPPSTITDEEIAEVKNELESMVVKEDVKETIHKIYSTEQQKEDDKVNKILLQDRNGMTGYEYIYSELLAYNVKHNITEQITPDKITEMINTIIDNNLDLSKLKTKRDLYKRIVILINGIRIIDGNLCYVKDNKKTYKRLNNEWLPLDDPRCVDTKKLISIKGECNTEIDYSKRVKLLLDNIVDKKEREKFNNMVEKEADVGLALSLLISYNNNLLHEDLKYNNEKERYGIIETQKEINKVETSPYIRLRDRILAESNIENKYKAIQLFINKYTKTGIDKYWHYCIETSTKLIPSFFLKLANAYLITNNLEVVEEEICLDQGTLSDNGDKWVDKHSGYIIKNISFDKEEGYDSKGYKIVTRDVVDPQETNEIFSEDVLDELARDKYIKSIVKVLFTYLGVNYIEDELLFEFIDKTYAATNASTKDANVQKITLLFTIISHVFIFIQTYEKKIKVTKPFPNCKFSFGGFPLINDEQNVDGLKYVVCVIKTLSRGGEPWKIFTKMSEDQIISNIQKLMKQIILQNVDIKQLIYKKRLTYQEEEIIVTKKWNNFYPRLKPIDKIYNETQLREQQINNMDDLKDRIYYLSVLIQKEIHNKIATIEPILTDTALNPYLVNACCDEDNYTYRYFLQKTKIAPYLKEILNLKRPLRKLNKLLENQKTYFKENTLKPIITPTSSLNEETMYLGIIKWSETNPSLLDMFEIPRPTVIKRDTIQNKILKMKTQGITINEETFINMLQKSNTIINNREEKKQEELEEDEILPLLENEELLADYLDKKNNEYLSYLNKSKDYSSKELQVKFLKLLSFNKTILHNKKNLIIDSKLEHLTHINQILYNKIQFLLFTLPQIFASKKTDIHDIICKHWNLSPIHNNDIEDMVTSYYSNLFESFVNEETAYTLSLVDLNKYKNLMKIQIHNPEIKNLLYFYIFLGIFYTYKTQKFKKGENPEQHKSNISKYLSIITTIFEREDRLGLNYDTTRIKYEVNISKKSETKIKTDYFKGLSKDARKAEGVMKETKLGKWGVGLQKSMFTYLKENYLKDKMDAKQVLENITTQFEPEDINIDEQVVTGMYDPIDDPAEYSSNVDEDYDNENED
jgi:hypothetical protein